MSTAVWIVMCNEPEMRAPASGLLGPNSARSAAKAGHLVLGEVDLLAAEGCEGEVGDVEVAPRGRGISGGHGGGVYGGRAVSGQPQPGQAQPVQGEPARASLMNISAAMGPGSTPSWSAMASDTRSP